MLVVRSWGLPRWHSGKESACNAGYARDVATYSRTLAWKIPWTEKLGRLQSRGCKELARLSDWVDPDAVKIEGIRRRRQQRMRWLDNITASVNMILSIFWKIVEDRGVWRAAVHGVPKGRTRLSDWTTIHISCISHVLGWMNFNKASTPM